MSSQETRFRIRVALNTDLSVIMHGGRPRATLVRNADVAKRSHGRIITVGAPREPGANWKCGTDVIWPVLDEEILRETGREVAYVCRHQIFAGD